ncbi:MAG: hypothetical protein KDD70_04125 [Bdellovibrionales bacterium]|nr:hypothetical protein [Bdellovibrionales bacterium]
MRKLSGLTFAVEGTSHLRGVEAMAGSSEKELSPWTSGSWHFNPKEVSIASPVKHNSRAIRMGDALHEVNRQGSKWFTLFAEGELLRLGYISLFAFSGFILALLAVVVML